MASYSKAIVVGNLTRDVEVKHLQSGMAVANITLAVNEKRKGIDEVSFIDCVLFDKTADIASQYLSKGSQALIEGRLKQESWEKDGQKRSAIKVIADKLVLLGSKSDGAGGSQRAESSAKARDASYASASVADDDDIPF